MDLMICIRLESLDDFHVARLVAIGEADRVEDINDVLGALEPDFGGDVGHLGGLGCSKRASLPEVIGKLLNVFDPGIFCLAARNLFQGPLWNPGANSYFGPSTLAQFELVNHIVVDGLSSHARHHKPNFGFMQPILGSDV